MTSLQMYIDDSYDDENGIYAIAGYVSSTENWNAFSKEWKELLPLSAIQENGRYRFKMSEMAMFNRLDHISAFHKVIHDNVDFSIAFILDVNDLNRKVNCIEAYIVDKFGKEVSINVDYLKDFWSDPFTFSYYIFIDNFLKFASHKSLFNLGGSVELIFDETSRKSKLIDGWDEYISQLDHECSSILEGRPRFLSDDDALPLQAADFRAWWIVKWAKQHGINGIENGEYTFRTAAKVINNVLLRTTSDGIEEVLRANFYGNLISAGLNQPVIDASFERLDFDANCPSLVIRFR